MSPDDAVADPLTGVLRPERVNYATGMLLDAGDFLDEQTYHRGRLAAVLRHLLGHGTLAGLRVVAPEAGDGDLELRVEAGLALDRHGRLIEVATPHCIRLARWFEGQETARLQASLRRGEDPLAVIVDVFLSLRACPRGKTPAFATGPFDALDAVVPSRLAEEPALRLVARAEAGDPPAPENLWPDAAAPQEERLAAVLGSWQAPDEERVGGGLDPLREHVAGEDPAAILLARPAIPVVEAEAGARPQLLLTEAVTVDNGLRPFIFIPGKWLGRAPAA
jgi:hypothetical protein